MKKLTGSIVFPLSDCTAGELTVEGLNVSGSDYLGLANCFKDSGKGFEKMTKFSCFYMGELLSIVYVKFVPMPKVDTFSIFRTANGRLSKQMSPPFLNYSFCFMLIFKKCCDFVRCSYIT